MDFLRKMIGAAGKNEDTDETSMNEAFDEAMEYSDKMAVMLLERSKKWANNGDAFTASLFLFLATWRLVGRIHHGVRMTTKERGKGSPVLRLWCLIKQAFGTSDMKLAHKRIATFMEDYEQGKIDD